MAEQLVEVTYGFSRVVIAEPPVPVRCLAGRQLLCGAFTLRGVETARRQHAVVGDLCLAEQIPGQILVALPHPRGERAVNPAARTHVSEWRRRDPGLAMFIDDF